MSCSEIQYTDLLQDGERRATLFYGCNVSTFTTLFIGGSDMSHSMKWYRVSLDLRCFPSSLDLRLLNWDLFLRFCDPCLLSRKTWHLILWMLETWCLSKPKVRYWFWQGIFIIMRKNFMIVRFVMGSRATVLEAL